MIGSRHSGEWPVFHKVGCCGLVRSKIELPIILVRVSKWRHFVLDSVLYSVRDIEEGCNKARDAIVTL